MVQSAPSPALTADAPTGAIRFLRGLERAVAVMTKTSMAVAGLVLTSIFGLIAYSVFQRYFFNQPQPWVDEVVGWLLVAVVMLTLPEVQRRNDHIGIDFLHQQLKSRGARLLVLAFGVFMVLVSSVILVREGIVMVEFSRMLGILSNQLPEVPLWVVQTLIPIGFTLMALVAVVQLLCLAAGMVPQAMNETLHGDVA